jgi:hypothetical protein
MPTYAKERDGCWHEVVAHLAGHWVADCGMTGQPYAGQPSSIVELDSPPSPLHCATPRCGRAWTHMVDPPALKCSLMRGHGGAHHYAVSTATIPNRQTEDG